MACLGYIFWTVDLDALVEAIAGFDLRFAILALAALAAGYSFRILRWALMLKGSAPHIRVADCVAPFLGSIALNNVLPFRIGDAVRAFVFPKSMGITRSHSLATLIVERLLDLAMLLALLSFGLSAVAGGDLPNWLVRNLQGLLGLATITLLVLIFARGLLHRLLAWLQNLKVLQGIKGARDLFAFADQTMLHIGEVLSGRLAVVTVLLSVPVWIFEACVFGAVMAGLGDPAAPAGVSLVAGASTIATLAPSSPGYFGPFHLAAFESYQLLFGEAGRAAALALLAHAALWVPTTLAGGIAVGLSLPTYRALWAKENS